MKLRREKAKESKPVSGVVVGTGSSKSAKKLKLTRRTAMVVLVVILVAAGAILIYIKKNGSKQNESRGPVSPEILDLNNAVAANDQQKALEHARKALAASPNDLYLIEMTANLVKASDPEEAKQLYARAFELYKKETNPDASGQELDIYLYAAGLAENAGKTEQAKQYYQKTIDEADPNDEAEQAVAKIAQEKLEKLQ